MTCRPNDTIKNLFGLYPYKMAAARTIFAFIVRAACRFESLYSREGAVYSYGVCPRDNAVCAFRSLFARFPSKPKKAPLSFFRMFRLAEHSPREALQLADRFLIGDELWFMPLGQGTSGRGLRPEMVPPGAVRIGHKIRSQRRSLCFLLMKAIEFSLLSSR